jgi:hypothetical protein
MEYVAGLCQCRIQRLIHLLPISTYGKAIHPPTGSCPSLLAGLR